MAKPGRVAEPVPLKILKGRGNGKDQAGMPIPKVPSFERAAPDPPEWLDDEAAELWGRVAPSLDALDLLKPEDRETFATYCTTWSRYVAAVAVYQREGVMLTDATSGYPKAHPAVKVAEVAGRDLYRFAQEFGLTPSAEINLSRPAAPTSDDDDNFGAVSSSA